MSAKNVDRKNRFRSITVGFRVSPEEQEELNRAVAPVRTSQAGILLSKVHGTRSGHTAESKSV